MDADTATGPTAKTVTPRREEERAPAPEPPPPAMAFVLDTDSEGVMKRSFAEMGLVDAQVQQGSIETAIETLSKKSPPPLLVVDVSGTDDPMMEMSRLADVCEPTTEVVVVGERNDIVLYRDLKAMGVAEYFFKPLVSSLVARALAAAGGEEPQRRGQRTGKLITVLGVRGGVGATTVTANAAWYFAEDRERRILLLDLDMQNGDAALQLDATPSHALREALEHPDRVDDLFLERAVTHVTPRLHLLAALEPLTSPVTLEDSAVVELLSKLLARYRYVFLDVPLESAARFNKLLHMPGTLVLVSDASLAGARDVVRWRERIGADTPERHTLHLLNKQGGDTALPEKEFLRAVGQPPDVTIHYDKELAAKTAIGVRATHKCASMRRGMVDLSRIIAGASGEEAESRSWLSRILPWA